MTITLNTSIILTLRSLFACIQTEIELIINLIFTLLPLHINLILHLHKLNSKYAILQDF